MAAYKGPRWPLNEILTGAYPELHQGYLALQDDLRGEHARKSKAIAEDENLSLKGRQDKLRQLAEQFRSDKRVKAFVDTLAQAQRRESEIRTALTRRATPKPKGADPAEVAAGLVEAAFARHRILERYERLSPEGRTRVVWKALDAAGVGDAAAAEFLSHLRDEATAPGEAGLLDEKMLAKVDATLMQNANPDLFREYSQLAGQQQSDGRHDPITSVTQCGAEVLRVFHEWLDEVAGIAPGARAAEAVVAAGTTDGAIVLSPEDAHSPAIFRRARDVANERGVVLRIDDGVDAGELMPTTPNGAAGQ